MKTLKPEIQPGALVDDGGRAGVVVLRRYNEAIVAAYYGFWLSSYLDTSVRHVRDLRVLPPSRRSKRLERWGEKTVTVWRESEEPKALPRGQLRVTPRTDPAEVEIAECVPEPEPAPVSWLVQLGEGEVTELRGLLDRLHDSLPRADDQSIVCRLLRRLDHVERCGDEPPALGPAFHEHREVA